MVNQLMGENLEEKYPVDEWNKKNPNEKLTAIEISEQATSTFNKSMEDAEEIKKNISQNKEGVTDGAID